MTYQEFKQKVDALWEKFWTGGIANPLSVIEQITYLIFLKMLDEQEDKKARIAKRTHSAYKTNFPDFKINPFDENSPEIKGKEVRWSTFKHQSGDALLDTMRNKVFPFLKQCDFSNTKAGAYLKDAYLLINKPSLLSDAINGIDALPLEEDDIKGNLYEYLLSKLSTAGINGQFRTPRHIIKMIVELVDPKKDERIADPMCGTAGFLVMALNHILQKNSSVDGQITDDYYAGDLLSDADRKFMQEEMFYGFDFDASMLRVASMNMMLHGIEKPNIFYQDAFSQNFYERHPNQAKSYFDVILANPPFKGSLDYDDVSPDLLSKVRTKKTEVLAIPFFLRLLKSGGRAGIIVPAGILSTENEAYKKARKMLIEDNQLDAVITMPSGVFKPYAGVATAVLLFAKGGNTDKVWFYEMENCGFSLDDKQTPIDDNDIPEIIEFYKDKKESKKSFNVTKEELVAQDYSLLSSKYKEVEYKPRVFEHTPQEYVQMIIESEKKSLAMLEKLQKMLEVKHG